MGKFFNKVLMNINFKTHRKPEINSDVRSKFNECNKSRTASTPPISENPSGEGRSPCTESVNTDTGVAVTEDPGGRLPTRRTRKGRPRKERIHEGAS